MYDLIEKGVIMPPKLLKTLHKSFKLLSMVPRTNYLSLDMVAIDVEGELSWPREKEGNVRKGSIPTA